MAKQSAASETNQEAPSLIMVKLKQVHTHAGVEQTMGAEIEVTEPEKVWLEQQGII